MSVKSNRELDNTREKLQRLERMYAEASADTTGDAEVRDAELQSLTRLINQLKEEIARYETRQAAER